MSNVAIIFGGKSSEHDISIITAVQAMAALDKKHTCIPIYIESNGKWLFSKQFSTLSAFSKKQKTNKNHGFNKEIKIHEVHLRPASKSLFLAGGKKYKDLDVCILCLHGMGGEDGTVAGLLELAGIPYTGSNHRASAVGMDKITLKHILNGLDIPITKFLPLDKYEYTYKLFDITEKIKTEFTFPLIIKPSNLGSSIGINLAHDFVELIEALNIAFKWDNRVIVEEALTDFTELNCAVLGYGNDYIISEIEEPVGWTDFLSFSDKYEGGFKGKSQRNFPAKISANTRNTVRNLALRTFKAIDAGGVARCDFLLKDDKVYLNEINTIPGSLSNYLFAPAISFSELLEKLIAAAIKAHTDKSSLTYSFSRQDLLSENQGTKIQ